jgi:hypothetical protein
VQRGQRDLDASQRVIVAQSVLVEESHK